MNLIAVCEQFREVLPMTFHPLEVFSETSWHN